VIWHVAFWIRPEVEGRAADIDLSSVTLQEQTLRVRHYILSRQTERSSSHIGTVKILQVERQSVEEPCWAFVVILIISELLGNDRRGGKDASHTPRDVSCF